ncbi:UNVERIFIED_CONTAM: hypothetical protein FKN15_013805 [Acipenser sinensis]
MSTTQRCKPLLDFVKEMQSSWGSPALAPTCSRRVEALYALQGAEKLGLQHFLPVDSSVAALVETPTISTLYRNFFCSNKQCRVTETHLKRAYSTGVLAAILANTAGLLTVYQSQLLQDLSAQLSPHIINELRLVNDQQLPIARHSGQAIGCNLGALVVARRQLWLSQASVPDAPISPGYTFGPVVEEMLQGSHRAREMSKQLATRTYPAALAAAGSA